MAKNNIQFRLDIATPALETLNLFTKYITASRKGHTAERPCLPSYCLLQIIFLPASVGKAGKQRSSELLVVVVVVTLLLPMHVKAYKAL